MKINILKYILQSFNIFILFKKKLLHINKFLIIYLISKNLLHIG